ncbi:MAG: hypothetical protein M3Z09_05895 [Acidobacteriota bacterium]|nr:hypothetical protein [Acidobacteriota bacterium]
MTFPAMGKPSAGIRAEFRSPSHKTFLIPGYRDGDKLVLRIVPVEPGKWDYRITSDAPIAAGKEGQFTATASDAPGYVEAANVHHFRYGGSKQPHLWMGDLGTGDLAGNSQPRTEARAKQHFTHVAVTLLSEGAFLNSDQPSDPYFTALDERILSIHRRGMTADLTIASDADSLNRMFPERDQRERAIRYLVARYGALNITWRGFEAFETGDRGRATLREVAGYLKTMDQYGHLQATGTLATSGPLFEDGWLNYLNFRSADGVIPAIEHQIYPAPSVNDFQPGESGADAFRHALWRTTMDGPYPETRVPDETAAAQMQHWFEFFSGTRHWELEPFFDAGGRPALALEGVEYIVYLEKPGPVTVEVDKHSYDVSWFNPLTGERMEEKKNFKGETFTGEPPDAQHDWVLHLSREGQKGSMLKSYKFESREVILQEVEADPAKVPFEITKPAGETVSVKDPGEFAVKLKKETRATLAMRYLWTGEVTADGESYRVVGTGSQGTLRIPANLASRFPASLHLRVEAINGTGKVYALDRNYQLIQ